MSKVISFPSASDSQAPHYAEALSFMRFRQPRGSGIDHWVVESTGDFGRDCNKGKDLAIELLRFVRDHPTFGNFTLLQCIVGDMMRIAGEEGRKELGGVELGFLGAFGKFAFASTVKQRDT